jgi:serine protease Do
MLRNLAALFLLFVLSGVVLNAQQKAETPRPERLAQVFSLFDGSYLGVQTQEVTRENFSKYGLSSVRGVAVEKVLENSPAAQAGLQAGDVIVRFNGEEITSTRKLTRLISEVAPDHQARITVFRAGSEREITVTMGKRPTPKFENGTFEMRIPPVGRIEVPLPKVGDLPEFKERFKGRILTPGEDGVFFYGSSRQIGVSVSTLTKQLGDYFGIADGKGLLINNVRADSPAAKAGLKAGDVIVEVEGKPVDDMGDLIRGVNEKKEGDVTLTIVRDRNRQTIRVVPEKATRDSFFYNFDDDDNNGVLTPAVPAAPKVPAAPTPAFAPLAPFINSAPVIL